MAHKLRLKVSAQITPSIPPVVVPTTGDVIFKIGLQGWNGFMKIEYPSFSQEYPTTLAMSFVTIVTLTIPVGVDVTVTMLDGSHNPLNFNPAQSVTINDGAFGAGWTFISRLLVAGKTYSETWNFTTDFPPASWSLNTSP